MSSSSHKENRHAQPPLTLCVCPVLHYAVLLLSSGNMYVLRMYVCVS